VLPWCENRKAVSMDLSAIQKTVVLLITRIAATFLPA
jgi:hypothetical protein